MLANPLISRTSRFFRLMHSFKNCETMPRENRICIALFDTLHHFVKYRTTRNFSRLFLNKFKGDVQIFSLGIVS